MIYSRMANIMNGMTVTDAQKGSSRMNTPEIVIEQTKKRLKRWQKGLLIVMFSLLALLIVAAIAFYALFSHYYSKMNYMPLGYGNETIVYSIDDGSEEARPTVTDSENIAGIVEVGAHIRNILIVGTDAQTARERGSADSIILLTVNEETEKSTLTSLMGDMYLYIPEVDTYDRLSAAYAHGGVTLLVQTIEANFTLTIDQYIRVNSEAIKHMVDLLGGVRIGLTEEEIDYIGLESSTEQGNVRLSGEQALAYCDCRSCPKDGESGDFARAARQREMLGAISEEMRALNAFELSKLFDVFLPYVTTNLTRGQMLSLLAVMPEYLAYEFVSEHLPTDGTWQYETVDDKTVITVDFEKNIEALEQILNR